MLDPKEVAKLRADFPKESVQVRPGPRDPETGKAKQFTGYKPQYIIERLNDCFGHEGWDFEVLQFGKEPKGDKGNFDVWAIVELTVYKMFEVETTIGVDPIKRILISKKQQFGMSQTNKFMPIGDAYKSAVTDAMGKCASMFDIGHKAYKGLQPPPSGDTGTPLNDLIEACAKHKIDKKAFITLVKTVLKENKEAKDLSPEEISQLIKHLNENGSPF